MSSIKDLNGIGLMHGGRGHGHKILYYMSFLGT